MLNLKEKIHSLVTAELAPEGTIYTNFQEAQENWQELGGHLLVLEDGFDTVYYLTVDDTTFSALDGVKITEVKPFDYNRDPYEIHPSAERWIDEKEAKDSFTMIKCIYCGKEEFEENIIYNNHDQPFCEDCYLNPEANKDLFVVE